jgi:UDP-galactopyranose mutase
MRHHEAIVTFSHLRWDFVYQRPQHILSRMANRRRVVFIEEPICDGSAVPHWQYSTPAPNVLVCRPHLAAGAPSFCDEHLFTLKGLIEALVKSEKLEQYLAWLYTPMALPLAQMLEPLAVVYDCMDELALFLHAPPQLLERETELLRWADLVFTGGPSLYKAKKGRHPNLHCFPSSVDAAHFRQARAAAPGDGHSGLPEARDQAHLPHPRLGFYGVIDERLDLELIDAMAHAHPNWQIIMVGPVVKIDPAALPRLPNIHWLGPRNYKELPAYLGGWDVCLLPFARNPSTRYISPTKTLEYMAAERMIVSTPITDVAEPYGDIVYLGHTPQAFIAACEQALAASPTERASRVAGMRDVLAHTSWHATVRSMSNLITQVIEKRRQPIPLGPFQPVGAKNGKPSEHELFRPVESALVNSSQR